jgi:hypothetical protein
MRQSFMPFVLLTLVQTILGDKSETKYRQHLIKCIKEITEREFTNNNALTIMLPHEGHTDTQTDRYLLGGDTLQQADADWTKPLLETNDVLVTSTPTSHNKRHNSNTAVCCNRDKNYVLFIRLEYEKTEKTLQWLKEQVKSIKNMYKWNAESHFVIAILEKKFGQTDQNIIKMILQEMYSDSIVNTIVLMSQHEDKMKHNNDLEADKYEMKIGAYTWFPYQNPKSCHHVEDITLIDTWLTEGGGKFVHNARFFSPKIKNDLNGCPIRVASFHFPPAMASIIRTPADGSGPDKRTYEEGPGISLFYTVAKAMNVTAVFIEPPRNLWGVVYENGSSDGITGQIASNLADISNVPSPMDFTRITVIDYTIPYHWDAYIWWVPCAKPFPKWKNVTRVFSLPLWLVDLASIITAAFFMLAIGKNFQNNSVYREISSCLAASWAVLLGVSVSVMPRSDSLRVFFIAWVCYSLAINTVFQAYFTSYLIDPGLQHQISSMDEIMDYKIELGGYKFLRAYLKTFDDPQINIITARFTEVETRESALKRIATQKDLALLDVASAAEWYINSKYVDKNGKRMVCSVNERFMPAIAAWQVKKGSPLTGRMNRILRRLFESGLIGFWVRTERQLALMKAAYGRRSSSDDEYCDLSMEHLQGAFYLLLLGHLLSTMVLLVENLSNSASRLIVRN